MTQDTDSLSQAIQTALSAAEAATDAASEAALAVTGHSALTAGLRRAQRRAGLMTMGAVAGALLAVGAAGLVYLRSVADLREAAALQTAAAGAWVDRMTALDAAIAALTAPDMARKADLQALSDRLAKDLAAAPPDAGVARLREDVLAALADIDLRLTQMQTGVAPAETAELTALLKQAIDRIGTPAAAPAARPAASAPAPQPAPSPAPAPAPKPKAKPPRRTGTAAPAPSPFSYP